MNIRYYISILAILWLLCLPLNAEALLRSHRGNVGGQPEHTVGSYINTMRWGANLIELDVQLSSDGVVVCIHDTTVDRTTNGTGNVNSKTLAQLKALVVDEYGATQQIPTLVEALTTIKSSVGGGRSKVLIEPKAASMLPSISKAIAEARFPLSRVALLGWVTETATTMRPYFPGFEGVDIYAVEGSGSGRPSVLTGPTIISSYRNVGYDGLSFWSVTWDAADYTVMQGIGMKIANWASSDGLLYTYVTAGADVVLTDSPSTSMAAYTSTLYSTYQTTYVLGASATTADFDGDGLTNIEELVYGTNPTSKGQVAKPFGPVIRYSGSDVDRTASITVRTPSPKLEAWWFKPQYSTNGTSWTDVPSAHIVESNVGWPANKAWNMKVNLGRVLTTGANSALVRVVPVFFPRSY